METTDGGFSEMNPLKGLTCIEGAKEAIYINTAVMTEQELIRHLDLCKKETNVYAAAVLNLEANPKKKQKVAAEGTSEYVFEKKVFPEHILDDKCRQEMFCMKSFSEVATSVESGALREKVRFAAVTPDDGEVCCCCGHGVVTGQINQQCASCGISLTLLSKGFHVNTVDPEINVCSVCMKFEYPPKGVTNTDEDPYALSSRKLYDKEKLGMKKQFVKTNGRGNVMSDYIECAQCKKMCHRECALVPSCIPSEVLEHKDYVCPICLLEELRQGSRLPLSRDFASCNSPDRIPQTRLSAMIEESLAMNEGLEGEFRIVIREMCRTRGTEIVPPDVAALYTVPPPEMPYNERVLFFFAVDKQNTSIVYVPFIVFAAEFHDTGGDANPNRGLVYVKYIDSAKHTGNNIRIKTLYAAYLNTVVRRGFRKIMKWVFPAQDLWFIFAFPPPRRMMSVKELHEWYSSVMKTEQVKGTVGEERDAYATMVEADGKMCMDGTPWVTGDDLPEHFQRHRAEKKRLGAIKKSTQFVRLWDVHSGHAWIDDTEGELFEGCPTFKNNNSIQHFFREKGGNDIHQRRVLTAYEVVAEMLNHSN